MIAVRECVEHAFGPWSGEPGRPVALPLARVLVLGSGGAARAAIGAARRLGATVAVAGAGQRILARTMEAQAVAGSSGRDAIRRPRPLHAGRLRGPAEGEPEP